MDEITMFTTLRPEPEIADVTVPRQRLAAEIAGTPTRRRVPRGTRLAIAGGLVAAAAAAAIIVPVAVLHDGGSTAWAVGQNPDGSVTVALSQVFNDPAGLQRALQAHGVRAEIRVVPMQHETFKPEHYSGYNPVCRYETFGLELPGRVQSEIITSEAQQGFDMTFTLEPSAMPPSSTVFLQIGTYRHHGMTWESADGPVVLRSGRLPACVPTRM